MVIMYFAMQAMNYFKSGPAMKQSVSTTGDSLSSQSHTDLPGNIFAKGTKFDMYAYISEAEKFTDFNDLKSLYWSLNDIEYGDWTGGLENDGVFVFDNKIELTEVFL